MNHEIRNALDQQDWAPVMQKLYAHAIFRLNWFGIKSEMKLKGWEYSDFAEEAVTLVFEGKRKWSPQKHPDIIHYLKGVVNSIIYSVIKSSEGKVLLDADLTDEINDKILFQDLVEKKIINDDLIEKIKITLDGKDSMKLIFEELALGMKPRDIEDKHGLPVKEINNLQKAIRRHIKKIIDKP